MSCFASRPGRPLTGRGSGYLSLSEWHMESEQNSTKSQKKATHRKVAHSE